MTFIEKLYLKIKKSQSLLCVGLDPVLDFVTKKKGKNSLVETIFLYNKRIIDATQDVCASYKPNIAFYECWGQDGFIALEKTIAYISKNTPIILDAKRGDIGSTAVAYAKTVFEYLKLDCVTLAPYMGEDSVSPFLEYKNAFVFVLVRTSNPASNVIQLAQTKRGDFFYKHIAKECMTWYKNKNINVQDKIGFVVAANEYKALSSLREQYPDTWFLSPGIGPQGGDMSRAIDSVFRKCSKKNDEETIYQKLIRSKALFVVARDIASAQNPREKAQEYNKLVLNFVNIKK